jgi:light-independent protochlorophyllide reductase subunit B
LPWYSRSVDSTYLTGKRVFIFGDGSHAIAAARIASRELGFQVVGLGTYSREMAREVRAAATELNLEALISDDYLTVEAAMAEAAPELVLGTQMERHSAKRLGVPCAVISAPLHVQDVPARYSPVMGFEGANVLFDSWVHPLMMGLEEHLIGMFRHDFEFVDGHRSHLGEGAPRGSEPAEAASTPNVDDQPVAGDAPEDTAITPRWSSDGEAELAKIPFFVRPKVKRNTETFARERGIASITDEVLYEAKAHFSR